VPSGAWDAMQAAGRRLQVSSSTVHVVVMGCGRVGSTIAHSLETLGQSVAVIDQDAGAFRRLGPDFRGRQVQGAGFDRDTLIEAGIEEAAAFAAVSSGDNSNIISARVARETFGIENVVARIYDPKRAEVYARLGIPTVATVRWTADEMLRRLLADGAHSVWSDPSGHIVLAEMHYDPLWTGHSVSRIEELTGVRVAYGDAVLVTETTALQDGDLLHVMLNRGHIEQVTATFTAPPESGGER
jgi:trk system potassium uptake protein